MAEKESGITRERLAELLNEDLSREYQAIIAYVVYSQVLKGAEYMNIADQLAFCTPSRNSITLSPSRARSIISALRQPSRQSQ